MRLNRHVLLAGAAAAPLLLAASGIAQQAPSGLVATGLAAPRGLSVVGDRVLVAEQGAGRLVSVGADGSVQVIAEGIAAEVIDTPEGPNQTGISSAVAIDGTYYLLTATPGNWAVHRLTAGGMPTLLADIGAYEAANNPDGDRLADGAAETESNPYDIIASPSGGLFVSDAAGNTVYAVGLDGTIRPYAVFPNRPNPLAPDMGGPTMDQVPTGLAIGPDGALYVGTLTGFPFPQGGAIVYRLADNNGDGDAMDEGEATPFATGLTNIVDIAFDADGSLLVAQFSMSGGAMPPGSVVRIRGGEVVETFAPLIAPTGLAVLDGKIVVSQEFLGIVAEIGAATMIASMPPPAAEGAEPAGAPPAAEPAAPAGVYTEAQATRGMMRFAIACGGCHSPGDLAESLGNNYPTAWAFYQFISASMPLDAPGSLPPQQYADIIAYFLRQIQFPAGDTELRPTEDVLAAIRPGG